MASDSDACRCPPLEMRPPAGCAAAGCEGAARAAGLTGGRAATSGRRLATLRPRSQRHQRHRRCEHAKLPPEAARRAPPARRSAAPRGRRGQRLEGPCEGSALRRKSRNHEWTELSNEATARRASGAIKREPRRAPGCHNLPSTRARARAASCARRRAASRGRPNQRRCARSPS